MPAAAVFVGVLAVETGVAAAIGTAIVGASVGTAVATAVGSGVISAGLSIAQGKSVSDSLKSAVIGGVASYVGASISSSVASSISAAASEAGATSIAGTLGKIAGAMAGGGVQSAIGAGLAGGDPVKALIKGGLTAGLTAGVMSGVTEATAKIPGFNDLAKDYGAAGAAAQRAVNAGVAAGVLGKDVDTAVTNSVLGSMLRAGGSYISSGLKDLTSTLQSAYDKAVTAGEALQKNASRQEEIVTSYNDTVDDIEAKREAIQANLDKYNENKDAYNNYGATLRDLGYQSSYDSESGDTTYYRVLGGKYVTREDGEGGTYQALVPDGTYTDSEGNPYVRYAYDAPTQDSYLQAANKYAKLVNDAVPGFEKERTAAETTMASLSKELDGLKADIPTLEKSLTTAKATLDQSVTNFQAAEEANAQKVASLFNDTLAAKTSVEQALGSPVTDEQLDAMVQTGDVTAAANDYIDIKTVDLAEAQQAALDEGYYFDPNDPELAAQFLGVHDEADTLAALQQFADARATTTQEATDLYRQTYADIYGPDVDIPDPTAEDLLDFMPYVPTDVADIPADYQNVAEDVVKGRMQDQFSQDLGFDDYADRTYAQESLGEDRPDVDSWNQFKGTSGVVGLEGSDITPVQFAPTAAGPATMLQDTGGYDEFGINVPSQDQYAFDPYGDFSSDQFFSLDEAQPVSGPALDFATAPSQEFVGPTQQFGFDTGTYDEFGFNQPDAPLADLGVSPADITSDIFGADTSQTQTPAVPDTTQQAELPTSPQDLTTETQATAPQVQDTGVVSQFGEQDQLNQLADAFGTDYTPQQGVQVASYQPTQPDTVSDTDIGNIGLRSLVTTQEGGTSAAADNLGGDTLTQRSMADTGGYDELEGATKGTATYSALTDTDPTKTIATDILGDTESSGDIHAGIDTEGIYSGKESEVAPSDTLTAKYLNEPTSSDTGTYDPFGTPYAGTGNDTTTFAEPSPTQSALQDSAIEPDPFAFDDSQFLAPLRTEKTTLPVSQDDVQATSPLRTTMDDYEDFDWAAWDQATQDYVDQYNADRYAGMDSFDEFGNPAYDAATLADLEEGQAMRDLAASQGAGDVVQMAGGASEDSHPGWGTTAGGARYFIEDDGSTTFFDPETGEYSSLTPEQSATFWGTSGTGGTGGTGGTSGAGGTGGTSGGTTKTGGTGGSAWDKVATAITNQLTKNPGQLLTALGGAALGAASKPSGITPRGLRSIATGVNPQLVQTGAKGTKGRGSVRYFEKKAEGGSIDGYARGGGLGYLKSAHDGMADRINATIDNKRPAKLSGGEFVMPADVVSHLGNGNSEAGARQLYDLMDRVRKARTGSAKQGRQIDPKKYMPR